MKQEDNESFTSFIYCLNYLVHCLGQCNDRKEPTVVVSKAIDSMHDIYNPIYQSIECGQVMPIHDLQELEAGIHNFNCLQGCLPGSPSKSKAVKFKLSQKNNQKRKFLKPISLNHDPTTNDRCQALEF